MQPFLHTAGQASGGLFWFSQVIGHAEAQSEYSPLLHVLLWHFETKKSIKSKKKKLNYKITIDIY